MFSANRAPVDGGITQHFFNSQQLVVLGNSVCAAGGTRLDLAGAQGHGKIRAQQGFFLVERTCPTCNGAGRVIRNPCKVCRGAGTVQQSQSSTSQLQQRQAALTSANANVVAAQKQIGSLQAQRASDSAAGTIKPVRGRTSRRGRRR